MEEIVKACGFESVLEFNKLVAEADISTPENYKSFMDWKNNDGTKEGLLKHNEYCNSKTNAK